MLETEEKAPETAAAVADPPAELADTVESETPSEENQTPFEEPPPPFEDDPEPVERPKRKKGRPKKKKRPEAHREPHEPVRDDADCVPFPKAPRAQAKGGTISPEMFFRYWRDLPAICMERSMVYIYREYPKMNYLLALSPEEQEQVARKKRQKPTSNIAKFTEPFESENWRDEMLRRFGEGDYRLWLNDVGIRGTNITNQAIIKCFVSLRDDEHPPVIPDIRCVDPSDPQNASYLEKMRLLGLLNSEPPNREEDDDMVNGALGDVVKDMGNKLIQMAGQQQQPASAAPPPPRDPNTDAAGIIADASKQAVGIMGDAIRAANENTAKAQDPKSYMRDVLETAKSIQPPAPVANNNDTLVNFLTKQMEANEQRHRQDMELADKRHERELTMLRENHTAHFAALEQRIDLMKTSTVAVGPNINPAPSEFKMLDHLLSLKEKIESLTGGKDDNTPTWLPYALQGMKIIGDVSTNIFHNLAVAKTGQGAALPPPETSADLEAEQDKAETNMLAGFARQVHPMLKSALDAKVSGNEFAARLLMQGGPEVNTFYEQLCADGPAGLQRFLQSAPEVWGTFTSYGAGRQNEIFMEQFLNRDAVMETMEILRRPSVTPQKGERTIITSRGPVKTTGGPVVNTQSEPVA